MAFLIKQGFTFSSDVLDRMLTFFAVSEHEYKQIIDLLYIEADGMRTVQIAQLKQNFRMLDKNGDGKVTVYEINDYLMQQGIKISSREL